MPLFLAERNTNTGRMRVRLNRNPDLTGFQAFVAGTIEAVNWTLPRFFTGFVWGFAFMLGLWLFGTLIGLR